MATFLMLGTYRTEGIKAASPARTKTIIDLISKCGGRVSSMYALMGELDAAFLVSFPGNDEAMRASFALSKATGITFATHPAVPVEQFDRLISGQSRTAKAAPRRQVTVRAPRLA